ncbi:hypothetical protein MGL_2603 [Malassezia globosa CBS 7966]|uniref:Uncharacterized protein n=1 Tax=Malassezia globosa (strain ATCC MYA-4612 / CBS 7966) TaxID=425265 RepID=A8Q4Q2_MALGO|nr:hypothetical protein MGL_2603 [Malassezia globosa CBS 7966]
MLGRLGLKNVNAPSSSTRS